MLALGVDLIVVVAFVALVVAHKRRVWGDRGHFVVPSGSPAMRSTARATWSRGAGRWVRDVLVWTRGPLPYIRSECCPPTVWTQQRPAGRDEVRRLGDHPLVVRLTVGRATLEIAAAGDERELLVGPYHSSGDARVQ
jgi:hypothetical protein